jgi:hypothetical protein
MKSSFAWQAVKTNKNKYVKDQKCLGGLTTSPAVPQCPQGPVFILKKIMGFQSNSKMNVTVLLKRKKN